MLHVPTFCLNGYNVWNTVRPTEMLVRLDQVLEIAEAIDSLNFIELAMLIDVFKVIRALVRHFRVYYNRRCIFHAPRVLLSPHPAMH